MKSQTSIQPTFFSSFFLHFLLVFTLVVSVPISAEASSKRQVCSNAAEGQRREIHPNMGAEELISLAQDVIEYAQKHGGKLPGRPKGECNGSKKTADEGWCRTRGSCWWS